MKRIFILTIVILLIMLQSVFAADTSSITTEYSEDGGSYVTIINDEPCNPVLSFFSTKSKTVKKSKTIYYKNSSGEVMWYVRVTGTFKYGNGYSRCISAFPSAVSKSKAWKVSNISKSRSSNRASATATGNHYSNGSVINSATKTVTLTCSPSGNFS